MTTTTTSAAASSVSTSIMASSTAIPDSTTLSPEETSDNLMKNIDLVETMKKKTLFNRADNEFESLTTVSPKNALLGNNSSAEVHGSTDSVSVTTVSSVSSEVAVNSSLGSSEEPAQNELGDSTTTVGTKETTTDTTTLATEGSVVDNSTNAFSVETTTFASNATTENLLELSNFGDLNPDKKSRMLDTKHTSLNKNAFCRWQSQDGPGQLEVGGELTINCQRLCRCLENLKLSCKPITCPYHHQPEISGCLEWNYDRAFQSSQGNCCAFSVCKTKMPVKTAASCEYRGRRFSHLEPIPTNLMISCDQECRCFDGNVTCESRCPTSLTVLPPSVSCPSQNVQWVPIPGDECCKEVRCLSDPGGEHLEEFDSLLAQFPPPGGFQTISPTKPAHNPFLVSVPREEDEDSVSFKTFGFGTSSNSDVDTRFPGVTYQTLPGHPANQEVKDNSPDRPPQNPFLVSDIDAQFPGPTYQSFPGQPTTEEVKEPVCETEDGVVRAVGKQWEESPGCKSRQCSCNLLPNGTTSIKCTGGCYPIERYLKPTTGCPVPVLVTPDDPCFCPYVMCNKTDLGRSIQNLTAVALNSTSVHVSLVIPQLYVGLFGQVEVLYTSDATQTNASTWNKEVFSQNNDLFAEAAMEHELHGLVPDTIYYVRANLLVRQTSNTVTSNVVTVRTFPLPASTTTTTTFPPHLTLDPQFNVKDPQPTSLPIAWRPLTPQEKRVVDGIQLKYRVLGDDPWGLTPLIHRDVTSFVLRNLQPSTAYEVDMAVVIPDDLTTEVETTPPAVFRTSPVHDDYAFNITVTTDKVLIRTAEIHWSGVPFPMHKYVNLYVIYYRMDQDAEPKAIYKPAKVEQVTLMELKPGNRYQIWMDAYLSNGDIRKSNTLEIMTKPGSSPMRQPETEKLETASSEGGTSADNSTQNSYYEALVAVAVVAAVCILGFVALLVLLLRRQGSATAPISAHKSQSAYDNPTYKPSYDGEIENGKTPT